MFTSISTDRCISPNAEKYGPEKLQMRTLFTQRKALWELQYRPPLSSGKQKFQATLKFVFSELGHFTPSF